MRPGFIFSLFAAAGVLGGCAGFEFYSDEGLKTQTGLKFYTAKPYLLVANTGNKDKPVEVTLISLPDLAKPQYAKPKSGLGTADLSLTLSNGVLTAFGQKTDTKIPELITSVGGLVEKIKALRESTGTPPAFTLYEIDNTGSTTVLREVPIK